MTYKETHYDAPTDPQDPPTWTGTWMDPRFSPPADGGQPQNALTGQLFAVNAGTTDITVPASVQQAPVLAQYPGGQPGVRPVHHAGSGSGTLGYEWDVDADNGFRPAGLMDMSSTTDTTAQPFTDYGSRPRPNSTATHHLTLYRAPSGALVFGAGTVQWAWGLDNGRVGNPASTRYGHAAGHGEPVRRHGRAARHADVRAHARHGIDRHDAAHVDDHIAVSGCHACRTVRP